MDNDFESIMLANGFKGDDDGDLAMDASVWRDRWYSTLEEACRDEPWDEPHSLQDWGGARWLDSGISMPGRATPPAAVQGHALGQAVGQTGGSPIWLDISPPSLTWREFGLFVAMLIALVLIWLPFALVVTVLS